MQLSPCALLTKELAEGLEPTTSGLQNRCSTIELRQRSVEMVSIESRQNPCKLFFRRRFPLSRFPRCLTTVHHSVLSYGKTLRLGMRFMAEGPVFSRAKTEGLLYRR